MEKRYRLPAFVSSGQYLINEDWGVEQLSKLVSDVQMLNSGISLKDLGYEETKKKSSAISYYYPDGRLIAEVMPGDPAPDTSGAIAHLQLTGVMRMEDGLCSQGIRSLVSALAQVDTNPAVKGIVLEVNSGGGEVTAGQALYSAIADLSKPLVVAARFMGSAAVLGTLPAKKIIAVGGTSAIGSIGTVFTLDKEFAAEFAATMTEIYATTSPEKNLEWREFLKGNTKVYQATADKYDAVFMDMVRKHRPLPTDTADSTLKGAMFLAADALDRGLVDVVGSVKDAYSFFNDNSNTNTMNFQAAYRALIEQCNRIFGITLPDNNAEAVATQMAAIQTMEQVRAEAVAEVNGRLTEMQTRFDSLTAQLETLQASAAEAEKLQGRVQNLENELTTLQDANSTLEGQRTDLEKQVADLKGKSNLNPKGEGLPSELAAERFMSALGELEVAGESKY